MINSSSIKKKIVNSHSVVSECFCTVLKEYTLLRTFKKKKQTIFMKAVTMKPYFSKFRNIHCGDSLFLVLNKNNVLLVFLPFLRIH